MKNIIAVVMLLMLTSFNAYAVTREPIWSSTTTITNKLVGQDGQTNFQSVGVTGIGGGAGNGGNAGYLALWACTLNSSSAKEACTPYYLWVDGTGGTNGGGTLCMASYPNISGYSSFPSGDWRSKNGMNCNKVSSQ